MEKNIGKTLAQGNSDITGLLNASFFSLIIIHHHSVTADSPIIADVVEHIWHLEHGMEGNIDLYLRLSLGSSIGIVILVVIHPPMNQNHHEICQVIDAVIDCNLKREKKSQLISSN